MGKVSKVEPLGGDSPGVKVTMKIKDEALPIHKDAQVEIRERIFLEGNLFMDIKPGSPSAPELDDGGTIPASQTSAPVQLDQVLGTLQTNTRKDLQNLLVGYGEALNGQPTARRGRRPGSRREGRDRRHRRSTSRCDYAPEALRSSAIVNQATLGTELHDLSKLIVGHPEDLGRAVEPREQPQGPAHQLEHHDRGPGGAGGQPGGDGARAAQGARGGQPRARQPERVLPGHARLGARDDPGRTRDAGHDQGRLPVGRARRGRCCGRASSRAWSTNLQPAIDDFAKFVNGQIELLPVFDLFNRCQSQVVLPSGNTVIQDGALSTGLKNYQEFLQAVQGLVGAGQNFTGNGIYTRFQPGGGAFPVQTGAVGHGTLVPRRASATRSPRRSAPAPRAVPSRPTSRRPPATSRARPT